MQTNIPISEIFGPTIQGEGRRAGRVSVFIRVGGCNMCCKGFGVEYSVGSESKVGCDSYYSVDRAFRSEWLSLSADAIIDKVERLTELKKVDIVITGGEPLLYWNNAEFQSLLKYYIKRGDHLTIETNGTIKVPIEKKYQKKIIFSIGLKLKNSAENIEKRINPLAITDLLKHSNKSYLKFVTSGEDSELSEIRDLLTMISISTHRVYLMPLGATPQELKLTARRVVQQSIKYAFRYSDRLHIRIWGDKRGV